MLVELEAVHSRRSVAYLEISSPMISSLTVLEARCCRSVWKASISRSRFLCGLMLPV